MTEAQPRQVEIYVAPNGKVPFKDWLNALRDLRARTKIDARIARLQLGNLGDVKSIGEGVQELRIDDGPGYRVYFGRVGTTLILLLCTGDKSTQLADIQKAKSYWADYKLRLKEQEEEEK